MTTEKQTENTPAADNKVIFAPLGKYAVIAIIMVSIIVTTAIMLEKQLNTIDQQVADIEAEIAESNKKNLISSEVTASVDTDESAISTEVALQTSTAVESTEAASQTGTAIEEPATDALVATEEENPVIAEDTLKVSSLAAKVSSLVAEMTDSTKDQNTKPTPATSVSAEPTAQPTSVSTTEQTHTAVRQAEFADRNKAREEARQARIDEFKLEQKNHVTELLARIKTLESNQLDRYKASQQNQVDNLRKQIARQQEMIEALILRNKDQYEMRSATIQRNQSKREQMLNRI